MTENLNNEKVNRKNILSLPDYVWFLLAVFVSGMILFLLFRLVLLFLNYEQVKEVPVNVVLYAIFNRGSLFDASVNSSILVIPFLLLSFAYIFGLKQKWFIITNVIIINVFYVLAIPFLSADIPYFAYFNSRLTNSILNWTDDLWLSVSTRFSAPTFYPYIFAAIIISIAFCFWVRYLAQRTIYLDKSEGDFIVKRILIFAVFGVLVFLGIRGDYKTGKMPLSVANSFFSDFSLPNQLGLNPVYSFVSSYKSRKHSLLDNKDFIDVSRLYLNINQKYESPIARDVTFTEESKKPNVVIFIVESMSAFKFKRYGYKENIMPFIDSLADASATFDNVFTGGVHTYDGIYSSLFSMPSGLNVKAMMNPLTVGQKHSGVSNVLKNNGYSTAFFCTGDKRFDNMNGFLKNNDFDHIFSQDDYPPEYNISEWGVPDNVMFDYSINKFSEFSKSGKPFLAAYMTVSTHEAIALPDWVTFKPWGGDSYDHRFQYFDWSVSQFMKAARNTDWFKNTVFVFIADHGQNFDHTYDMSLSYNHTPMIFYSPDFIKPQRYEKPGLQIDLFPTLMGFLRLPYINNTLGVDLRTEGRKYAFFCTDNKIGCLNEDYFLVLRTDGPNSLYKYKSKDLTNYYKENNPMVNEMKKYATSMIQTSYWLGENNLLHLPNK